jgi:hypothetical protein
MFTIITNDRLALVRDLATAICSVTFTKLNGERVTRLVTLNPTVSPISMSDRVRVTLKWEVAGADRQNPRANIVAWDIQGKHLISFYAERVSAFCPILTIEA